MSLSPLEELKIKVEEEGVDPVYPTDGSCPADIPLVPSSRMFTDAQLQQYLDMYDGHVNAAAYDICLRKSRDTTLKITNLSIADQSKYWLRRAAQYRPNRSHNAPRADDFPPKRPPKRSDG